MSLIVQKFGGSSVGTPDRIRLVAERIARTYREGHQLVVVVSAMGHTTDELLDLARGVSKSPPGREVDMLLSAGERISMALVSMALSDLKVPALSFTGSQSGIITDQSHRRARIQKILGDRLRKALAEGNVAIVAGFQGVSQAKEITTLGRGGSDTSAVALAVALKADFCDIYTDVDGVYSADPRIVPEAKLLKTIPHRLMVELANRGAGVLHPRSVDLAKQYRVSLRVRNSLNEKEGTVVVSNTDGLGMEEFAVSGVTADRNKVLITVNLCRSSVLGVIWEYAAQNHIPMLAPVFDQKCVRFFSDRDAQVEWKKYLDQASIDGFVESYEIGSDIIPLSVVGDRFSQDGAALYQITEALSRKNIPVFSGSASSLVITVAILLRDADEGVRILHSEWIDSPPENDFGLQNPNLESLKTFSGGLTPKGLPETLEASRSAPEMGRPTP